MKSTQTKIVSLRTDPNATEQDNAKYLNKELYELQKDDPSTSVINIQLYELNGDRYAMIIYETESLSEPGNLPPQEG